MKNLALLTSPRIVRSLHGLARALALCAACCVLWVHHAAANIGCAPFLDSENLLTIGHHPLGLPAAELPAALRKLPCGTAPAPGEEVCEYLDEHGVAYLVDTQSIIRIEARLGVLNKTGQLPLGLKLGDAKKVVRTKIAQAVRQSSALNLPIATLGTGKQFRQNAWSTHYCVDNTLGASGSWYLNFDRYGRLMTVGIRLNV
jgi:hypothetical protein